MKHLCIFAVCYFQVAICHNWSFATAMAAEYSANELVQHLADDSFIGDAEENGCIMAVSTPPTPRNKSIGQGPRPPEASGQDLCFLCELPGDILHKLKGVWFHIGCKKAALCHTRQISLLPNGKGARAKDIELMRDQPTEWRKMVYPLVMPNVGMPRSAAVLQAHHDNMIKYSYVDSATVGGHVLLTKSRFIQFQRQHEGYSTGSASESFERRLEEASTDNALSDDSNEPQVRVRDNTKVEIRRGNFTHSMENTRTSHRASSVRGRQHYSSRARHSGRRRDPLNSSRGRSRSNRNASGSIRGRACEARAIALSASPAVSARRGTRKAPAPSASGVPAPRRRSAAHLPPRPDRLMRGRTFRRGKSSANLSACEETQPLHDADDEDNPGVVCIRKIRAYNKELEAFLKKQTLKSHINVVLKSIHDSLSAEQQQDLSKHGDVTACITRLDDKVKVIKDLHEELKKLEIHDLDGWEARKLQAISDFETEESRANKLKETAQEIKLQGSEERKAGKNAEFYQKTKIANRLVDQVQFGKEFAKGIATRWRSAELKGIEAVKDEGELDFREVLVWSDASERGKAAIAKVSDFQKACKDQVADKVVGVKSHLALNKDKEGLMVQITTRVDDQAPPLPSLKDLGFPEEPLFAGEEGASPWLAVSRPWHFRIGPGVLPLPGFGTLVQRKGDAGCALVVLRLAPLVDQGVVMLHELRAFLQQDSGGRLASENATVVLWKPGEDHIAWIPYGHYPIMVATDEKDKLPSFLWMLPIYSKVMVDDCPPAVWTPVATVNLATLQKHSGQQVWKARLETAKKLIDARAAS